MTLSHYTNQSCNITEKSKILFFIKKSKKLVPCQKKDQSIMGCMTMTQAFRDLMQCCFPRVPTAGQNGQLLGLYWPATLVEDIKSCYPEVKASKSDKRL